MHGRVLVIAGSDSGGGAGIQADIKAITALNGYAMTAITALTAQNTQGVSAVIGVDPAFVKQQMQCVAGDIGVDAFKTGMLDCCAVIEVVADFIMAYPDMPFVLDPVMVAKGGSALLQRDAIATMWGRLVPLASIITPNIPEAEILSGQEITTIEDMKMASRCLIQKGARAVLLKGGHLEGDHLVDILVSRDGQEQVFTSERVHTRHTHGTGCTLASAIATGLAQGMDELASIQRARSYLRQAILTAPGFGKGAGPLNHAQFGF